MLFKKLYLTLLLIFITTNSSALQMAPFTLDHYESDQKFTYPKDSKKVTVLNFWATWCTSCIQEVPELEKLKKANPNANFLAINAGDSKRKIKKFLKKTKFSYLVLMDKDKSFSKGIDVLSLPITIVLNSQGKIVYRSSKPPLSVNEYQ